MGLLFKGKGILYIRRTCDLKLSRNVAFIGAVINLVQEYKDTLGFRKEDEHGLIA